MYLIIIPFLFGLFEATFFFIIPDVFLTYLALFTLKGSLMATGFCLLGALIGGMWMYFWSRNDLSRGKKFLLRIPAISEVLLKEVWTSYDKKGHSALLTGSSKGIPYKIFAVFAPHLGYGPRSFFWLSIPARGMRFILSVMVTYGLAHSVFKNYSRQTHVLILSAFWCVMYLFYFWAMSQKSSKVLKCVSE